MAWKVCARDVGSPMQHVMSYTIAGASRMAEITGKNNKYAVEFSNFHWRWCVDDKDWENNARILLEMLENRKLFEKLSVNQRKSLAILREEAEKAKNRDYASATNSELSNHYQKLFDSWTEANFWGDAINLTDFEHFMLSNKLMVLLQNKVHDSAAEAFAALTTPSEESMLQKQDREFLELILKIKKDGKAAELFGKGKEEVLKNIGSFPEFDNAFENHENKWDWMHYQYDGPTLLKKEYFIELACAAISGGTDAEQELKKLDAKEGEIEKNRSELVAKLNLSENEKYWFELAKEFLFLKGLRKDSVFLASRCVEPLLKEIAKRLKIPIEQARYLTISEAGKALEKGSAEEFSPAERVSYSLWVIEEGTKEPKVLIGNEAREFAKSFTEDEVKEGISELKGTPAFAGKVRGTVKIILHAEDMKKMEKGNILVSHATNPNLVPAMKKAGAIITDEGGITCHAAIVSRELHIPCIVGTRMATKALKDGDEVEVDATKGIVRKI